MRVFQIFLIFFLFTGFAQKNNIDTNTKISEPPISLKIGGLGNGYSSPVIAGSNIFITGEKDSIGYLFAFDLSGKLKWKIPYGLEFMVSYPGSRSTPIVKDSLIYTCSGWGQITCLYIKDGKKIWSVNMIKDLSGINPTFGYSMNLLIDGDKLFCSPGGLQNNVVAINRFSGEKIWSSAAKQETAGYGEPLIVNLPSRKILVTASEMFIQGLDAETGDFLWSYELAFKGEVPCNKPVYDGTYLYWVAGPGNGAVAAELSADGSSINVKWKNPSFDTFFGDFVHHENHLYGFSDELRKLISVDKLTGQILDSIPFSTGSVIKADNMLIGYNQKGKIGLFNYEKGKIKLLSSFAVKEGTKEHFSHPVYANGSLYIRHGDVLFVYEIVNPEKRKK